MKPKTFQSKVETPGQTPSGHKFTLISEHDIDAETGNTLSTTRSLQWHAFEGVGPIQVPLRANCPWGLVFHELTSFGKLSDETRSLSIAA